jgi:nicotinamidase-related amidase
MSKAMFVLVDVQEKLLPAVSGSQQLLKKSIKSLKAASLIDMQIVYTEQYPKGLGETVGPLKEYLRSALKFEKTSFSCFGAEGFEDYLRKENVKEIIVIGIEAHVCIYQTCKDARDKGFKVTLLEDVVSSRGEGDCKRALINLEKMGVFITTFECFFMEQLKGSKHPAFREFSALLKD